MTDANEVEEFDEDPVPGDAAPHVSLGYPTPTGWAYGPYDPHGATVGHAAVGEPSDMRKVKAPVDPDPIDLAGPDVPVVTEVSVITGTS
jgi:hypothetical protein